jgi:hypothetical protein
MHADAPDWSFYNGILSDEKSCQNGVVSFCETKTPGSGKWWMHPRTDKRCALGISKGKRMQNLAISFEEWKMNHGDSLHGMIDDSSTSNSCLD